MEDENKRLSWSDFFIKGIIIIIFVLFTVWLLSLSNRGITSSLDVLTDKIFAENIDRMKDAGIWYFTNERLPQKIGGVATISLEKMYDEKLVLPIKDKHGNACSAKNSYVSVEKFNGFEYHMKVYLECGEEKDYIKVILGCYDYCDSDVCEKKEIPEEIAKQLEYEYSKTTGGYWTDWGTWSEWSKVTVTKTNYRDVETKVIKEPYSYDKTVVNNEYKEFNESCPDGYIKDGNVCSKVVNKIEYANPNKCPTTYNGHKLVNQNGFTCHYEKNETLYANPTCPSGYSRDGFTCTKTNTETITTNPVCPDGYSRDGFTCSKTVNTPYYASYVENYGVIGYDKIWDSKINAQVNVPIYGVVSRTCPSGTSPSGSECVGYTTSTDTKTATCPNGYSQSGNTCAKTNTSKDTTTATCPSGYDRRNSNCVKHNTNKITTTVSCPKGYNNIDNKCVKKTSETVYKDTTKTCPSGYDKTSDGSKCYKEVSTVVQVHGQKEITYYRYRLREYVGGTVDYKWSTSQNDLNLINAGYKLTGRTREIRGK